MVSVSHRELHGFFFLIALVRLQSSPGGLLFPCGVIDSKCGGVIYVAE